ncbi:MAG: hypothetical protein JRD69_04640 [Deltaproteobacteria bacterium]|nr:hypothetical protein [Deltaproteobacteria bacterium]
MPIDRGNMHYGGHEALVLFDHVFVLWDRVFMYKEYDLSTELVENFAAYEKK